jgi:hypothetical protein
MAAIRANRFIDQPFTQINGVGRIEASHLYAVDRRQGGGLLILTPVKPGADFLKDGQKKSKKKRPPEGGRFVQLACC